MNKTIRKISSVNTEGVDRKLNVAVSRARQQFVLIGNKEILEQEKGYRDLIEKSFSFSPVEILQQDHHPAE